MDVTCPAFPSTALPSGFQRDSSGVKIEIYLNRRELTAGDSHSLSEDISLYAPSSLLFSLIFMYPIVWPVFQKVNRRMKEIYTTLDFHVKIISYFAITADKGVSFPCRIVPQRRQNGKKYERAECAFGRTKHRIRFERVLKHADGSKNGRIFWRSIKGRLCF